MWPPLRLPGQLDETIRWESGRLCALQCARLSRACRRNARVNFLGSVEQASSVRLQLRDSALYCRDKFVWYKIALHLSKRLINFTRIVRFHFVPLNVSLFVKKKIEFNTFPVHPRILFVTLDFCLDCKSIFGFDNGIFII